jgi:putative N6-adenine-specific DNA methylase
MMHSFFAPCPRGLEDLLENELRGLGASKAARVAGGVRFEGGLQTCYRANLESRFASRVLLRVSERAYRNEQEIYETALALPWHQWFDVSSSIRVDVNAVRSPLKSLDFATLRIKDAICDRFRKETTKRPDVDTRNPDVRIHGFLETAQATLYIDMSGEPLYKRGYRTGGAEAPLKENLAAGIIALSGWTPDEPLMDPMCGSGTLLIEAALMGLRIAPGAGRSFGFERMKGFDAALWKKIRDDAHAREERERELLIFGSDLHPSEVERAREYATAAGVGGVVRLKQAHITDLRPPPETRDRPGVIVMNPPYGVRMGERDELAALYPKIGDWLKQHFAGWRCHLFSGDADLAKLIRLQPSRRVPLFNGAIECRLYEYRMVSGSMRRKPPAPSDDNER